METWNPEEAEARYIRGSESYEALAKALGISRKRLQNYGQAHGWFQKRQACRKGEQAEPDPEEILRRAARRLCLCAGTLADKLALERDTAGKGDLKALHDAAGLVKDLAALLQNLEGREDKGLEVIFRMEGEIDAYTD